MRRATTRPTAASERLSAGLCTIASDVVQGMATLAQVATGWTGVVGAWVRLKRYLLKPPLLYWSSAWKQRIKRSMSNGIVNSVGTWQDRSASDQLHAERHGAARRDKESHQPSANRWCRCRDA